LNSEFLWFQRILSVLLDSNDREKAKKNFIDAYKKYFDGNQRKEEKIQIFESTYQSENALQWYSRECFFFEVLNKALRTQDIDVLFSLRFFLKDIYDQLKIEYDKTSHEIDFIVYQSDKTIVSQQKSPFSLAAVLLRMNLFDKAKNYYQKLLDEGSIIDIPSVDLIVNCYWGLSIVNRKQGEFDIALAYQCLAIEQSNNRPDLLLRSYKYISLVYLDIHSIADALEYQTKALEIQQNINDTKDQIADTLYNLGMIYFSQLIPEKDRALEYFFQALNIYKELDIHEEVIRCYDAIGQIYLEKKQKDVALNYHLQALQSIDEHYSTYLPYRINSYEFIAKTYQSTRDYEQAMKYYNEALNIKLKYEPLNDPNIADSYELLGGLYHKKRRICKSN